MERHYKYKGKIYINVDHLDDDHPLVKEYLLHTEIMQKLCEVPSCDRFKYELVRDNAFFTCPLCGSNRFSIDQVEDIIYCSNRDLLRRGEGVDVCTGFKIKYNKWVELQSKDPNWKY